MSANVLFFNRLKANRILTNSAFAIGIFFVARIACAIDRLRTARRHIGVEALIGCVVRNQLCAGAVIAVAVVVATAVRVIALVIV